jgi:cytochrome P450/NADPH-cytochrome P450 reductase
MVLQRFDVIADDPAYELKVKETLTLKPDGFFVRVKRRGTAPFRRRSAVPTAPHKPLESAHATPRTDGPLTPLLVLFGSNAGSAQSFAQRIVGDAATQGFAAELGPMDEYAGRLPKEGAVVVVTASYEGQPPDNARQLVAALDEAKPGELGGVKFAVFGCGNRQWARTYQAIPIRVDGRLEAAGGTRLLPRGEADASGDFFGAFDAWYATLWPALAGAFGKQAAVVAEGPLLDVELVREGRSAILRQTELLAGRLVENRELVNMTSPLARSKRHLEIALPDGMTYRAGDYLAILPRNPPVNVDRALRRFGFAPDAQVILHKTSHKLTQLPTEYPVPVFELLSSYVELGQPATRAQVDALHDATMCPPEKKALEALAQPEAYSRDVLGKRVSVLDLLERFAACELGFGAFLEMLPPLTARQYSISSSPLWNDKHCTLTVAVVDAPAMSGQGKFLGVASSYLASAAAGTRLSVAVRPSNPRFHPPADLATPIMMICAGTGLAPFRGFLQERAMQAQAGQRVGRALLFFGCDHPDVDLLYAEELSAWQRDGIVELRSAFTQAPEGEVQFVQHRVWKDRAEVAQLFREGATVYLCGDGRRMAPAVRDTLVRIYVEATGATKEDAERWADKVEREYGRFVSDVFA